MAPPAIHGGAVHLKAATRAHPSLLALTTGSEDALVDLAPGEYIVADSGRDYSFHHDTHDGYYYQVVDAARHHLGWVWQGFLRAAIDGTDWDDVGEDASGLFVQIADREVTSEMVYAVGDCIDLKGQLCAYHCLSRLQFPTKRPLVVNAQSATVADAGMFYYEDDWYPSATKGRFYCVSLTGGDAKETPVWTWEYFLQKAARGEEVSGDDPIWDELAEMTAH